MLLLTARFAPPGAPFTPPYQEGVSVANVQLKDGRQLWIEVREVEAAFEIQAVG